MLVKVAEEWKITPEWRSQLETRKAREDSDALEYLRKRFPDVDDEAFFTDYRGKVHEHVVDAVSVSQAAKIEHTCLQCVGKCTLTEKDAKPTPCIEESTAGFKYLAVRWVCGITCRYDPLSGEFGRMFHASGLVKSQLQQTFENYECGENQELKEAKKVSILAAKEQSCLILGGRAGTGKTHLATAVAIYAMKHGRQAIFRLVNELLDELRDANTDSGDKYSSLMHTLKEVPCLVLDDFSKERITKAGSDYLYQIIDSRYRKEQQTVITTNAQTIEELENPQNAEYITPMVSRLMGRGTWVRISQAEDYRVKRGVKKTNV